MLPSFFRRVWFGYCAALIGTAAGFGVLKLLGERINPTTVALAFLLVILFVATLWGSGPAVFASLLAVVCFNFFFLPPFGTFIISAPDNWIAFVTFLITAFTVGQLSARAKRRVAHLDDDVLRNPHGLCLIELDRVAALAGGDELRELLGQIARQP